MAGKTNTANAAETVQEAPKKEKMVTIRLPLTKEDTRPVYVRVNGRKWGIPRGQKVEVPECVAEVLEHAEEQMLEALRYSEEAQEMKGINV